MTSVTMPELVDDIQAARSSRAHWDKAVQSAPAEFREPGGKFELDFDELWEAFRQVDLPVLRKQAAAEAPNTLSPGDPLYRMFHDPVHGLFALERRRRAVRSCISLCQRTR